jgi:hypothetical protein
LKEAKAAVLSASFFEVFLGKTAEKGLTEAVPEFFVNPPVTVSRRMPAAARYWAERVRFFRSFFLEVSSEKSGKSIDEGNSRVLVGNLSLIGKLFEIYFVRLIGTPNQNSKIYGAGFGRHH